LFTVSLYHETIGLSTPNFENLLSCQGAICVLRYCVLLIQLYHGQNDISMVKLHKNELVFLCNLTTVGMPRQRGWVRRDPHPGTSPRRVFK